MPHQNKIETSPDYSLFRQWQEYISDDVSSNMEDSYHQMLDRIEKLSSESQLTAEFEKVFDEDAEATPNEVERFSDFINSIITCRHVHHETPQGTTEQINDVFGIPFYGALNEIHHMALHPELAQSLFKHELAMPNSTIYTVGLLSLEAYSGILRDPQKLHDFTAELTQHFNQHPLSLPVENSEGIMAIRGKYGVETPKALDAFNPEDNMMASRLLVMFRHTSPSIVDDEAEVEDTFDFISGTSDFSETENQHLAAWETQIQILCDDIAPSTTFAPPGTFDKLFSLLLSYHVYGSFAALAAMHDIEPAIFAKQHIILDEHQANMDIFQETDQGKFVGPISLPKTICNLFSESVDEMLLSLTHEYDEQEEPQPSSIYLYHSLAEFRSAHPTSKRVLH